MYDKKYLKSKNSKLLEYKSNLKINYSLNWIDLKEYNKIDEKNINKFLDENKENLENFNKLIELDYLINNKIDIKENKEKRKKLIDENLENKFFNIYNLENFIKILDENKINLINDKKYIDKVWKKLDSMDKSIYESIINYFILNFLDKDYFLNLKYLNSKIKSLYSKKDLKTLDELNTFNFKELKSNFLENFNNKYILDYIKEYNKITKDELKNIYNLLLDKELNKENYKFKLLLIKENNNNIKNLKEFKNKHLKEYNKINTNINNKLKRYSFKIKEKYNFILDELLKDEYNNKDLLKMNYKNRINIYKNNLFNNSKDEYKKFLNDKNIRYLNYLNNNLDLDLDKDKKYKSLKLILDYKLKSN